MVGVGGGATFRVATLFLKIIEGGLELFFFVLEGGAVYVFAR